MFAEIYKTDLSPDYNNADGLNRYPQDLLTEYVQSMEEGLDIERYKDLFASVAALPAGAIKTGMSDQLFQLIISSPMQPDYPYNEPSSLQEISALRKTHRFDAVQPDREQIRKKIHGAWLGRAAFG